MALYKDLSVLINNSEFKARVQVAAMVAAEVIRTESTTTKNNSNRFKWAKRVFENPRTEAQRMLWAIVAANKDSTINQIISASDAAIQSKINAAVDMFADGS